MPVLTCLREKLWTGLISVGDQVPTCPVFTRAKIKSRFGIFVDLPSHCLDLKNWRLTFRCSQVSYQGHIVFVLVLLLYRGYCQPSLNLSDKLMEKRIRKKNKFKKNLKIKQTTITQKSLFFPYLSHACRPFPSFYTFLHSPLVYLFPQFQKCRKMQKSFSQMKFCY